MNEKVPVDHDKAYPEEDSRWYCSVCGKKFSSYGDCREHIEKENGTWGPPTAEVPVDVRETTKSWLEGRVRKGERPNQASHTGGA